MGSLIYRHNRAAPGWGISMRPDGASACARMGHQHAPGWGMRPDGASACARMGHRYVPGWGIGNEQTKALQNYFYYEKWMYIVLIAMYLSKNS